MTALSLGASLLSTHALAGLDQGPETTEQLIERKLKGEKDRQAGVAPATESRQVEGQPGDEAPPGEAPIDDASVHDGSSQGPPREALAKCQGSQCWDHPPTSPVRIAQLLEDCFAIGAKDEAGQKYRRGCFAGAMEKIQAGLRYQQCTWGTADPKNCGGEHQSQDYVGPDALEHRQRVKVEVTKLLRLLKVAAHGAHPQVAEPQVIDSENRRLIESLRTVRLMTAQLIFLERGKHSLVSQGGVSLGNWQAGYVYFATEVLKERRRRRTAAGAPHPRDSVFKTSVGASAGAINALAAAVEGCRTERLAPHKSLVFDIWVNTLGAFETTYSPGLFAPKATKDPKSLFSKKPLRLAMELARQRILETARETDDCTLDYGFVTTHLKHLDTPVHVGTDGPNQNPDTYVSAPRLTERFPVRLELSRGKAQLKALTPPQPDLLKSQSAVPENAFYSRLVPVRCEDDRLDENGNCEAEQSADDPLDLYSFLKGVRASGAFPVAFPSARLRYKLFDVEKQAYVVKTSEFVDGGTLDNRPIGLAVSLNRWSQEEQLQNSALPGGVNPWLADLVPATDTYFFLNPSVLSWKYGIEREAPVVITERPLGGRAQSINRKYRQLLRSTRGEMGDQLKSLPDQKEKDDRSLFQTHVGFAAELMNVSLDARLMATAEEHPFMRQEGGDQLLPQLVVPRRHLPITAEHLAHFMAFMERDFRIFDFVAGMADAREHLAGFFPEETGAVHSWMTNQTRAGDPDHLDSHYECLTELYDANLSDRPRRRDSGRTWSGVACHNEKSGNFNALVNAMLEYRAWTQGPHDPSRTVEVFIKEVMKHGYRFEDVPKKYLYGSRFFGAQGLSVRVQGDVLLRNILDEALEQVAKKHRGVENVLVDTVGRAGADLGVRRYFPSFVGLGLASRGVEMEVTDSFLMQRRVFNPWLALRSDFRFRAHRLDEASVQSNYSIRTLTTSAGYAARLVFGVHSFKPGVLDVELGGGPFVTARWGLFQKEPLVARGLGFSGTVAAVLLQRIYLMADYERYFRPDDTVHPDYQDTRLAESPREYRWGLSAGIRLFWEPLEFLNPVKPRSKYQPR